MARVAKAADGHAVQVHRLHEMAQQRPLQAQDVPSKEVREKARVMVWRVDKERKEDEWKEEGKKGRTVTVEGRHGGEKGEMVERGKEK